MGVDNGIAGKILDQAGGVIEKAYDDLAHPSAKSVGNTLSLIPRTVGVWLGKWEKWVVNGEESIRLTAEAVEEKALKIPEENLTEPEPYVAVPLIQQLSYCYNCKELRELYANLLVSAMNTDTKEQVHPAFVNIIKQLSAQDAQVLEIIRNNNGLLGTADVCCTENEYTDFMVIKENITVELDDIFTSCDMCASSLKNLDRLGVVEIDHNHWLKETDVYDRIEQSSTFMSIKENINTVEGQEKFQVFLNKCVVKLTAFGKAFCDVCCLQKDIIESDNLP